MHFHKIQDNLDFMEMHLYLSHLGTINISKRYQIKFQK